MSRARRKLFDPGQTVGSFTIVSLIGQGGYGDIYSVKRADSDRLFAMKTEALSAPKRALERELFYLGKLQDSPFFPALVDAGQTLTHVYFVLELLGPSVSSMRRLASERRFSLKTALRLSLAMLQALRTIHGHGIVHGDVKPGNFLLRTNGGELPIVLIDFGMSKRFLDPCTGVRYAEGPKCGFRGTAKYASLNVHRGHDQCPKDDLMAWLYSTVELVDGRLPWSQEADAYAIRMQKSAIDIRLLLRNLPEEYLEIAAYLKGLTFRSNVVYDYLIGLASRAVRRVCVSLDDPYDWEGGSDATRLPHAAEYAKGIPCMELEPLPDVSDEEPCACSVA
jgi:serine/threonine protein kinase